MAGIESSKKFLSEVSEIVEGVEAVLADGKITLLDLKHAPALFADVKSAVEKLKGMQEELKDLQKEEIEELLALVIDLGLKLASKFDIKA